MHKIFTTTSLLFVFLVAFNDVWGQTPTFTWAKQFEGDAAGQSVVTDANGNVYTAGGFQGTVDFDPGAGAFTITSGPGVSGYISKLDGNGNFVWAKHFNAPLSGAVCATWSIALDVNSNPCVTGYFLGTIDFDPGPGSYNLSSGGANDIFIAKLDAAGNFAWAKKIGGTNIDGAMSVSVDGSGNVYTTGNFALTVDFDPGPGVFNLSAPGNTQTFMSKLDANGNFVWAKQLVGPPSMGYCIKVDAIGNVYCTGFFEGVTDFDPGVGIFNMSSIGNRDVFVTKLDASGNFVWAKQFGGTADESGRSICFDTAANVYLTGVFAGTTDFDPGVGTFNMVTAGGYDIFISKLDASGNFVWAKQTGTTTSDYANSIALDGNGNVLTTGFFEGTVDFDPGPGVFNLTSFGTNDVFINKLDSSGNFIWAGRVGGVSGDVATSITVDSSNYLYITGYFSGTVDFDAGIGVSNLTGTASSNAYVMKYAGCALPSQPSAISGNTTMCSGSSNPYSITSVVGATSYTWTLPSGWSGTSTTNSINTTAGSSSGQIAVTANNACGNSAAQTLNVTVNSLPTVTLSLNATSVCIDNAVFAFSGGSPAGGNFSGTGVSGGNFNAATAGVGTHTITYTFTDGNGCTNSNTDQVVVDNCTGVPGSVTLSGVEGLNIEIYPNPTNGSVTLSGMEGHEGDLLAVMDVFGKIILQSTIQNPTITVDLTQSPAGLYFLQMKNENQTVVKKIIKQ